tara:strand:+ start:363 stop:548 length:186 start_codon:yes stop_codon:yes gene_type:complete
MKVLIIMWVLTLSDLSSVKKVYEGSLQDCLHESLLFNVEHDTIAYAGCYAEVKQTDFVPRK